MLDLPVITGSVPEFLRGMQVTLLLLVLSLGAGLALSVPLAVARASRKPWLRGPVWLYTYVLRGTPLLVQLFMIYFGLAQFEWVRESAAWVLLRNAWFCAWLAFTLNTSAYTVEILAGAITATPHGEVEAARSLGMSGAAVLRRVVLPGSIRRALPQYGNEAVQMLHATAIASTVTLVEITRVARDVYANSFLTTEAFGTAAVIYGVLTALLVGGFRLLERRYLRHLRPAAA